MGACRALHLNNASADVSNGAHVLRAAVRARCLSASLQLCAPCLTPIEGHLSPPLTADSALRVRRWRRKQKSRVRDAKTFSLGEGCQVARSLWSLREQRQQGMGPP